MTHGDVLPSVTCTAQATLLNRHLAEPTRHCRQRLLWRETGRGAFLAASESAHPDRTAVSNRRTRAKRRGKPFRWRSCSGGSIRGAAVDISVTPKPYYGADGSKAFGIHGTPLGLTERLEARLGPFPFASFWGPMSGLPCTQWIARWRLPRCCAKRPDLTLVYLPHLDYDRSASGRPAATCQNL